MFVLDTNVVSELRRSAANPRVVQRVKEIKGPGRREDLCFEGVRVEWPREQESLYLIHVLAAELVELAGGLDAFGEGRESEVPAELDERAHERFGLRGGGDRTCEHAGDLQAVDRESLEVGEARVAGAKVIDGDLDAELLDRLEAFGGRLGVAHERGGRR